MADYRPGDSFFRSDDLLSRSPSLLHLHTVSDEVVVQTLNDGHFLLHPSYKIPEYHFSSRAVELQPIPLTRSACRPSTWSTLILSIPSASVAHIRLYLSHLPPLPLPIQLHLPLLPWVFIIPFSTACALHAFLSISIVCAFDLTPVPLFIGCSCSCIYQPAGNMLMYVRIFVILKCLYG